MKCANPECANHRPSGILQSLWASRGFVKDGRWFCSSGCHARYLALTEDSRPLSDRVEAPPSAEQSMKLGEILIAYGTITEAQLTENLEKQKETGLKIGRQLVADGLLTWEVVLAGLSKQKGTPWVDASSLSYNREALALVDEKTAKEKFILPFDFGSGGQLLVAASFPDNSDWLNELERRIGRSVLLVYSPEEDLIAAIQQVFNQNLTALKSDESQKLSPSERRLSQILLSSGSISQAQLEQAMGASGKDDTPWGLRLVRMGFVSETELAKAIGKQYGLMWVDLSISSVPRRVLQLVPKALAYEFGIVPLSYSGGTLVVATADPGNGASLKRLETRIKHNVEPVVCSNSQLIAALGKYYGD